MFKVAAYALIGVFFLQESFVRQGAAAKSFDAPESDQGTTRVLGASYGVVLTATPFLNRLRIGRLPAPLAALGLGMMAGGLALRYWAVTTLGEFYSRTLRTSATHRVVQEGPYAYVRHPGYASTLLVWIGFGLAQGNLLSLATAVGVMGGAYARRIRAEEEMLKETLGEEYRAYAARTPRLIPRVG